MSPLSKNEPDVRSLARAALKRLSDELELEQLGAIEDDFDIFEAIDSFAIVELLMITEAMLEEEGGTYVPLANEKIFDAEHSPLHSFERWAAHIEEQRCRA